MTLPTVVSKYREKVYITQLKKMAANMETMLATINSETGSVPDTFKQCHNLMNGQSTEAYECFADMIVKYMKLNPNAVKYKVYNYNTDKNKVGYYAFCHRLFLEDGSVIAFHLINDGYVMFGFDVNGDKGPNKVGQDLFQVHYYPYTNSNNSYISLFKRLSFKPNQRNSIIQGCKGSSTQEAHPQSCLQLIYDSGFEVPEDYPIKF